MLPLGVDRRINQNPEHNRKSIIQSKNWNTYRKIEQHIRKSKQVKHKNTKTRKKRGVQQIDISAAKIIYGEDDRTKKHHQRI